MNSIMTNLFAICLCAAASAGEHKAVPSFTAKGTDGKTYNAKSLSAGKPTLMVFFAAGCPHNVPGIQDMNRLYGMLGGKVRLVGMTNLDPKKTKIFARNHQAKFPILADPSGMICGKFGADAGLDNALILPGGQIDHLWSGYDQTTLKQLESELKKKASVNVHLSLASFPQTRELGCAIGMDMN